jgi:glyoxylase-like metal-dependent hydrolase (beta-lactamase superfamily II)
LVFSAGQGKRKNRDPKKGKALYIYPSSSPPRTCRSFSPASGFAKTEAEKSFAMDHLIVPVTLFQQNCTLLWCPETRKTAIVDPGGDIPVIQRALKAHDLLAEKILITHGHLDHAGGAADLAKTLGIPIEGPHLEDKFWIDGMLRQCMMFGMPPAKPFIPDRWLNEGDQVTVGAQTLDVLLCPGHTPGHVVFFHRASKLALVGDVLFAGSIGRTDFPRGDHDTLIHSIRSKLWPLGDDVTFIPGHGPTSTFGEERRGNPYVHD